MTDSHPTRSYESHDAGPEILEDPEKGAEGNVVGGSPVNPRPLKNIVLRFLSAGRVELRGVLPIPLEERTSTQYSNYVSNFPVTAYHLTFSFCIKSEHVSSQQSTLH